MDQGTTQYDAAINNGGDGTNTIKLFTDSNVPDASVIANYSGWDITDDEDNQTAVWKLHSGDNFGPRLNRDDEEGPGEAFSLYSGVTP